MPGGDRTGPMGGGPRTGRGLGNCNGNEQPNYASSRNISQRGRGFRGRGLGFGGRGWRNRFHDTGRFRWEQDAYVVPSVPNEQDIESLKSQAMELQDTLKKIQARLDELES